MHVGELHDAVAVLRPGELRERHAQLLDAHASHGVEEAVAGGDERHAGDHRRHRAPHEQAALRVERRVVDEPMAQRHEEPRDVARRDRGDEQEREPHPRYATHATGDAMARGRTNELAMPAIMTKSRIASPQVAIANHGGGRCVARTRRVHT